MVEFKKYTSIENSFNGDYMNKVRLEMPTELQYVVQEKVHGANTSFICDGDSLVFAKRTAVLTDDEKFHNYQEIVERYLVQAKALTKEVMSKYPDTVSVSVFGELFGGKYPHKDVKQNNMVTIIQKGIYYTPEHEFYGFDVFILLKDGTGTYLPVDETNTLFEKHGFFYAKTLFRGTLEECLRYPNTFQSKIAEWLGLPAIEGNICEGVVIKPVTPMYLRNGNRVVIKNKNPRFAEVKQRNRRDRQFFIQEVKRSNTYNELLKEVERYVTPQRLVNVKSHIGEVTLPRDTPKLAGLYTKDVIEDFLKEYSAKYNDLDKPEQKAFNKKVGELAKKLILSN